MGLSLSLSTCFPHCFAEASKWLSLSPQRLSTSFPPLFCRSQQMALSLSLRNLSLHCFAEASKWDSLATISFPPLLCRSQQMGLSLSLYRSLSTTSFPPLLCRSQQMGLLSLHNLFPPHCSAEASKWDSLSLSPQPLPSTAFQQPAIATLR